MSYQDVSARMMGFHDIVQTALIWDGTLLTAWVTLMHLIITEKRAVELKRSIRHVLPERGGMGLG